jgi:hypothetical protein
MLGKMTKTRNNHYVPQWYQEGFFEPDRKRDLTAACSPAFGLD